MSLLLVLAQTFVGMRVGRRHLSVTDKIKSVNLLVTNVKVLHSYMFVTLKKSQVQ